LFLDAFVTAPWLKVSYFIYYVSMSLEKRLVLLIA
jgi:hypothetical protein